MTTQQDCSVGFAPETTFGTAVAPARWWEFTDEKWESKTTFVQGTGLKVGSPIARDARRAVGKYDVAGEIDLEVFSKGLGLLLQAALGTATSTLVVAGVYQQLFTLGLTDYLQSYTVQKGIPTLGGGPAVPFTFDGCVCSSLELTVPTNGIATIKTAWLGRKLTTLTTGVYAYAPPSYAVGGELLTFVGGQLLVGGGVTVPTGITLGAITTPLAPVIGNVTDFTMKIDNNLDGEGWRLGGQGYRTRPPAMGLRQVTGTITAEFDSVQWRDAYLNQTPLSLVANLAGQTILSGATVPQLQVVIPRVKLEGDLPNANKGGVVVQTIPYTVLDGQVAASPLYIANITSDLAL